jgi:hypothetical protein
MTDIFLKPEIDEIIDEISSRLKKESDYSTNLVPKFVKLVTYIDELERIKSKL